jgi:segregation and condensation protein A
MQIQPESDFPLVKIQDFEGPLDLLLLLIKRAEINIYDIPIAEITKQYLCHLEQAVKIDLENITEFYAMAATLLHIKSQMLLPSDINLCDEIGDSRKNLVERLITYQEYKKLSELVSKLSATEVWSIERNKDTRKFTPETNGDLGWEIGVLDLLSSLIYELLESKSEFLFVELIGDRNRVQETVCAFLAILEGAKMRVIEVFQKRLYGDISVHMRIKK